VAQRAIGRGALTDENERIGTGVPGLRNVAKLAAVELDMAVMRLLDA
jgi:hypothetical protein